MPIKILNGVTPLSSTDNLSRYTDLLTDLNSRFGGGTDLSNTKINFSVVLKKNLTEGELVYEFRPFQNIRYSGNSEIIDGILPGELIDFSTKLLNFDNNHPVEIEIQPSYDGSVNLILNDDLNPPRLINSRFSVTENSRFYIVDREGNKDTNIYDDDKLENQTRLYKTINKIPKLDYLGLESDGNFKVGNYVFYFRLVDADGNESDIITESGIVSCHVGNTNDPSSIRGGLANENSGKSVKFKLSNLDSSYNFLNVYYSRSSASYEETEITTYFKIDTKFSISSVELSFKITGYEPISEIGADKINLQYNIIDSCKTQAQIQNMLLLANIHKATVPYRELKDLSLRILPAPYQDINYNIGSIDSSYKSISSEYQYYDTQNVYYKTGYWDKEMYRFAIVYIMNDYSLSNPFNLRGRDFSTQTTLDADSDPANFYTIKNLYNNKGEREYIEESDDYSIVGSSISLENTRGVIKIGGGFIQSPIAIQGTSVPIGIKFYLADDVINELKKYTKGFFIVRQKRVPTILCQALSIGHDKASGLPLIPTSEGHTIQAVHKYTGNSYNLFNREEAASAFVTENKVTGLTNSDKNNLNKGGILVVPDVILNSEYLGTLFTGSEFKLSKTKIKPNGNIFSKSYNPTAGLEKADITASDFFINSYEPNTLLTEHTARLTYVPEDVALVNDNNMFYSSRAGYPEEAFRFSGFLKTEDNLIKGSTSNVLVRGIFFPFVGCSGNIYESGSFFNIHTLGYNESSTSDYFTLRYFDNSPFYSISDRYEWSRFQQSNETYLGTVANTNYRTLFSFRGDCFINQVTLRVLRNFQDSEVPINDKIIDRNTLNNFQGYKNVSGSTELIQDNLDKINRADVNSVRLGYWITFKFLSNINYAFRCIDSTNVSEYALTGRPRGFYPLYDKSTAGSAKLSESSVMNVGYNSTTSDKKYFVIPDVPAIKNDFSNRVMYSEIHINDAFKNGYRIFEGLNYKDYSNENGSIVKIVDWFGNIIVVFEHGVGILPINERTLAGSSEGENVYLRGAGVLPEKPLMLSYGFGSTWSDSVRQSQNYVYGVDTVSKKIWRTDGRKFEIISDFKVQKFLNDNITFSVYDKTVLSGVRNVKTHYNAYKQDIMFTFYDEIGEDGENVWNLCFNEQLNTWITKYTWVPNNSENIDNIYFSFNRDTVKVTSKIAKSLSSGSGKGTIYIDSVSERFLTPGDYLSLFYQQNLDTTLLSTPTIATVIGGVTGFNTTIPSSNSYAFTESSGINENHPMYLGFNYNNGISSGQLVWTFNTITGNTLIAYDNNSYIKLADVARLNFYKSNGSEDILIDTKYNNSIIGKIQTDENYPILKVELIVDPLPNAISASEVDSLSRDGWYFHIYSATQQEVDTNSTEYFLTLAGREEYNNVNLEFNLSNTSENYDNIYFKIKVPTTPGSPDMDAITVNHLSLQSLSDTDKFNYLVSLLSKTNLSLYVNLDVEFKEDLINPVPRGTDKFKDILFIRPSLDTLTYLRDLFDVSSTNVPPLRPGTPFTPTQQNIIWNQLNSTIINYQAESSTYLYKHGQAGVFKSQETFKPAYWYGKQHPFEYEFVVNGDELGIHKIFDNLKIISNRVQPESFEFEIVGDVYEFTKSDDNTDLNSVSSISGGELLPNYMLLNGEQVIYNKTSEYRILTIQQAKNIDTVGLRSGNLRYKEDMWEISINPILYKKISPSTSPIKEAKIRDKYCKVRVKYKGNQLAIITALQTLYTLSFA